MQIRLLQLNSLWTTHRVIIATKKKLSVTSHELSQFGMSRFPPFIE